MKKSIFLKLSTVSLLSLSLHGIDINVQADKGFKGRTVYAQVEIDGTLKKPAEIAHIGVVADPVLYHKLDWEQYMFQMPFTLQNIPGGTEVKITPFVQHKYYYHSSAEMAIPEIKTYKAVKITVPMEDTKRNIELKFYYEKDEVTFEIKGPSKIKTE